MDYDEKNIPGEVKEYLSGFLEGLLRQYQAQTKRLEMDKYRHRPEVNYAILYGEELERQVLPLLQTLKQ
jgi:hypothetical protein